MGRLHMPVNNTNGCREFTQQDFRNDFLFDEDSDLSPVVMVERGGCTFVTKVRNIEKLGIKLAIIADNQTEDTENLIMADDGTGHSINIPSFIIRKKEADILRENLSNSRNSSIYLKAELEMVHPDNRVEYEFWYSTILDIEYWRLYDIALYQKALNDNALFTPRILTYSCKYCSEEVKQSTCIANGEYCPYFPKEKLPHKLEDVS